MLKANPNKLSFGSPGIGTSVHMSGELFKSLTCGEKRIVEQNYSNIFTAIAAAQEKHIDEIAAADVLLTQEVQWCQGWEQMLFKLVSDARMTVSMAASQMAGFAVMVKF